MALSHFRGYDIDDIVNETLSDFLVPFFATPNVNVSGSTRGGGRRVPTDFIEHEKEYEIRADLPGVPKDKIQLNIEGDTLTFGPEQQTEQQEQEDLKWHRRERSMRWQKRAMRLPDDVDTEHVNAAYDNGVLSIKIPKKPAPPPPETKHITIS